MKQSIRNITEEEIKNVDLLYRKNIQKLRNYADLLLWWNEKVNLVSRDVSRETIEEHIRHSLFVSVTEGYKKASQFVDTGTGGGLPGIPLALISLDKIFVLNDIVSKKVFAVNDMIKKLGLAERARGEIKDIQQLNIEEGSVLISKHAFKAGDLYQKVENEDWESIIMLKGVEEARLEIEKIQGEIEVNIINLDCDNLGGFYEGKGIVEIKRVL